VNIPAHPCDEFILEVRFLLDAQRVPVSIVQNLRVGHQFPLASDPQVPVLLTASDRRFARGRVCRVGDSIAVRVEELLETN
jgi:flagellar motor switch/type III secretory pathway protein FliN